MTKPPFQLIKGAGDVGSAIAHRLRRAGLRPVLVEGPTPVITRRRMAFGTAVLEGKAELEGLRALRCATADEALACLEESGCVPVLVADEGESLSLPSPQVVVDARMRKKSRPPAQIGEAALVIGVGPAFRAGEQVHAVVESNWGPELGRVLWQGESESYTGRHRVVEGHGRERYLYAPHAGIFHTSLDVLALVEAGQVVGTVEGTPLTVEIGGMLRGLAGDNVPVAAGAKLVEVDPRRDPAFCIGIAERPGRIADGVLAAIREKYPVHRPE